MFSDSTRGDISPSELGSGEGSGEADFTIFDTSYFTGSTLSAAVTEESETPVSGATTGTGTTEFGTEMTESSDITRESDVTFEGSGTTIEEGSGASASTDALTEETSIEGSTSESGSMGRLHLNYKILNY